MAREIQLDQERLRRLTEVGPWLISQLDLETVLTRLLETARSLTGARYAALGVLNQERTGLERFLTHGLAEEDELAIGDRPQGRGVLGMLIADPRPLRIGDLSKHQQSFGFPAGHPPMKNFLGVPIIIGGFSWGDLYLTDKEHGEFDADDEQAVEILASWAAIAIEHSRALEAANERQAALELSLRRLGAMQAIAVAVGAETELPRVLELIAKRGRAIVDARSLVIFLQEGDDLIVAAGAGHVALRSGLRMAIAGSTSGEVLLTQQPIRITDVEEEMKISPSHFGVHGVHSALLVPLIYRGGSLGVLGAFDRETSGQFDVEDEHLLTSFAASAATAVATAQSVQAERLRHTLEAAEAERKHWARELHDETLQGLGGLKILASSARRNRDPERIVQMIDQVIDGLDVEIQNLHSIISSLRPAALDDLGLRPAIETLAEHHRVALGLEVGTHLRLPDPATREPRLTPELEVTIYRLIQEALTNAVKHADATHVDITVTAHDGRVNVRVVDDGKGFDTGATTSGFGLTGMRERVELAGGSLELLSTPGGTTVAAVLPSSYVS